LGIDDAWAAIQLDNAVVYFGTVIENAASETHNVGTDDKPAYRPRHTMTQLLSDGYIIQPDEDDTDLDGIAGIMVDEV
jgi:hypothetical protein